MAVPPPRPADSRAGAGDLATSPAASILTSSAPNAALYNFRLLAALRTGTTAEVQPFIDELKNGTAPPDASPGRLLGMAVRVASVPVISLILHSAAVPSPNLPIAPGSTGTALHVASEIGRAEAVEILLNDPRIDDTIRDDQGRTALECAANEEVATLIEQSRAVLQNRFMALLAAYVASPLSSAEESANIVRFLEQPRAELLNLNALDERTGTSLLHEAARRRDLRLVELTVKRGADVFVRDRRGKRVLEHDKGADERIKAYLKQFSNKESVIQLKTDGRPPDLKGFLSKWVNYRSGWKTRWFVLENGILSYYRNREDELVACRGSIALTTANFRPSSDGTRFEISSAVSTSVPKIIAKSSLRGEIARWVQAIRLNMEYYQKGGNALKPTISPERSDARSVKYASSVHTTAATGIGSTLNELPPTDQFLHPSLKRSPTSLSGISATGEKRAPRVPKRQSTLPKKATGPSIGSGDDDDSSDGNGSDDYPQDDSIPHESEFELGMLNLKAQLELTEQLVGSVVTPPSSSQGSPDPGRSTAAYSRQQQVKDALRESLATVNGLVARQHEMSQDREKYLLGRIKREVQARKLWEENLLAVAEQQAETDRQLTEAAKDNEKKRRALRQARGVLAELSLSQPASPKLDEGSLVASPGTMSPSKEPAQHPDFAPPLNLPQSLLRSSQQRRSRASLSLSGRGSISMPRRSSISIAGRNSISFHDVQDVVAAIDDSEDEDDEFFDAIETGTIPNLRTFDEITNTERPATPAKSPEAEPAAQPDAQQPTSGALVKYLARPSLEPYSHVRHRLPIDDDKRPSVSLWSILKSSIGKDLTKITFPVSFNECTSMLQRMAEDMEYDGCLTVAAQQEDSLKRIAFVAAFAMSNYSSTIGRIAKPFNPMLSQSFEYAIPNRYRYVSEQVSHHPPISACYAEAPTWKYFGEVDAKNKFQGRYFEIRPTGVAHAELIIPKQWVRQGLENEYPKAGPEHAPNTVVEHYSWKKVTTNVSNFIMGSPIIDHYGDLVVTNHRTGETCTLTFKPRGWRGKDAFEIKGEVHDAAGNTAWEIAGRWDQQLIARAVGASSEPLGVDEEVEEDSTEYLQLWRNTQKPKAPFNLTPYAMTLNDIPQGLERWLAPTDCRLRTDMRAFENAEYDRAQNLKTLNEEKQRETRRLRAEGRLPPHEPQWFIESTDDDSGERLWVPKRADDGEVKFWHDREEQGDRPPEQKWPEVDHIFVED